ncbi:MAG: hypothetical protein AB8H86_30665 [Polyangiales bacterium]
MILFPRIFVREGVRNWEVDRLGQRFVKNGFDLPELHDLVPVEAVNWRNTLGAEPGAKLLRARRFCSEVPGKRLDDAFASLDNQLWAALAKLVSHDLWMPGRLASAALLRTLADGWGQIESTSHVSFREPFAASELLQRVSPGLLHAWGDFAQPTAPRMLRDVAKRIASADEDQIVRAIRETMARMGYLPEACDTLLQRVGDGVDRLASCPETFVLIQGLPHPDDEEDLDEPYL